MSHEFALEEAVKHKCKLCDCKHYPSCQSKTEECCDNCLNGATGDHVIINDQGIGIVDTYDSHRKCLYCDEYFGEDDEDEDCPCNEKEVEKCKSQDKHDKAESMIEQKVDTRKPQTIKCIHCNGPLKGNWTGTKACGKCCKKLYQQYNGCEKCKLKTELRHMQQEEWDTWHCPKCQVTCTVCEAAYVLYQGDVCISCTNKHKDLESSLCDRCGKLTKDVKLTPWNVQECANLRYCDKCRQEDDEYENKSKMEAETKMQQARQDVEIAAKAKIQKRKRHYNEQDNDTDAKPRKTVKTKTKTKEKLGKPNKKKHKT